MKEVHFSYFRLICLYKKRRQGICHTRKNSRPSANTHSISMENRTKLNITGVEDVESFDENAIIMNTSQGDLIVRGTGLHIGRISLDVGQLSVEGSISELSYEDKAPSGGFWQKLFG